MSSMITIKCIENDLSVLGLRRGDIVNVHSSMKKIGSDIEDGPRGVIQALLNVIGPEGTLIMPVFSLPKESRDLKIAPSRLGLITETFRNWPGVLRSNDPTHSVAAIGRHAQEIIEGHERVPPLGAQSPLHKAALMNGKTLHLGTDLRSCSLLHVSESLAKVTYLGIGYTDYHVDYNYRGVDGIERIKKRSEAPGDSAGFLKALDDQPVRDSFQSGLIGEAESQLYDSRALLEATVNLINREMGVLLCDKQNCKVCVQRKLLITESK